MQTGTGAQENSEWHRMGLLLYLNSRCTISVLVAQSTSYLDKNLLTIKDKRDIISGMKFQNHR